MNPTFDENRDMPKFPGYKNKSPGKGFEWRGSSSPEDNKGNWYNRETGESYHWDVNHSEGKEPHWDYKHPEGWKRGYRIFEDGSWEQKFFEGAFYYG